MHACSCMPVNGAATVLRSYTQDYNAHEYMTVILKHL